MSRAQLPARAQRSMMRLGALMGQEVLSLPIEIAPLGSPHVAYTTHTGIFIRQDVIDNEPQNIAVYVGHELLHHVLEDPFVRATFHPWVVNQGTDYIINHILKQVYKLDVRKVNIRGLYDSKFRRKTLLQACAIVADENKGYKHQSGCGVKHGVVTNPVIYEVAKVVRERLKDHSMLQHLKLGENLQLVRLTKEEDQALFDELSVKYWRIQTFPIPGIDYNLLVRSLYARLFSDTVRYDVRKEVPVIGHSIGIALAVQVEKLRKMTRGDAALALTFSRELVSVLSTWGTSRWKDEKIGKIQDRISRLSGKVLERSRYSSSERSRFKESIKRAEIRCKKIIATEPLSEYLTDENRLRIRARKEPKETLMSMLREALTIKDDHLPRFRKNEMVDQVRKITRSIFRKLREIDKTRSKLETFIAKKKTSDVKSVEEKKKPTHDQEHNPKEQAERQNVPKIPLKPLILPKIKEEETEDEEVNDAPEDEAPKPKKGKKGPEVLEDDDEGESTEEQSEEEEDPEAEESGQAELSDEPDSTEEDDEGWAKSLVLPDSSSEEPGEGSGESAATLDVRMLETISANNKLLKKILVEADVFREKLAHAARSHAHPDSLVDRTFAYGNEVQKADYSGLAKLATEATRLSFFADVGNHSLLQHSGTMPKRGSVIIALDCSGSMAGDRYAVAAGFAVAMLRLMADLGRGCALIKFSSNIDGMYVADEGQPVDILTLLESLVNPSYGGTNFDAPFEQSMLIVDTFKWKNPQMILVTDGYGEITKAVMDETTKKMRVTGIVVKPNYMVDIEGINDIRYINSLDDLKSGLLQVGRALC